MSDLKIFTDVIEATATDQIYTLIKQPAFENCKVRIMPDCLTEDTEILTTVGFKYIKDLSMNDKIANYDNDTKKILFNNPKNIIMRDIKPNEKIYEYSNKQQNYSIKVSENHRMAIKNNMGEIAKNIPEIYIKDMLFSGDGLIGESFDKYTDNEIKIIAWIVGDGSIKTTHNTKTDNLRIRFGLKKQRKINELINILKEEHINYTFIESDKQTDVYFSTVDSKKYIELLGENKTYPTDFICLNKEQSLIFINEIIKVDGDYESFLKRKGFRINSKVNINLDIIAAIVAINFGVSKTNSRIINSSYIKNNEISYTNVVFNEELKHSRSGLHNKVMERSEIKYEGSLVCVECDTSYFIARQNGLTFITGNCHAGAGCVIGFTADLGDKVIPNIVGVDIGCGMGTFDLGKVEIDFQRLDDIVRKYIPNGREVHEGRIVKFDKIQELYCYRELKDTKRLERSIGTLGGGNHFIEIDEDDDEIKYLVIHSGSRNLGKQVADHYQNLAIELMQGKDDLYAKQEKLIIEYKASGRRSEIQAAIKELHRKFQPNKLGIPKELCYLEGEYRMKYLHDMKICQEYADINRRTMARLILDKYGFNSFGDFTTVHNYIDIDSNIVRKGAVSAKKDEILLIPINMRDGSLICKGKGNDDWNHSAPHGAGRLMSRSKAKELLSVDEFKNTMSSVWTSTVNQSTLDEAPMAYKSMDDIVNNISDTVEILKVIKPVYNFKASE